MLGVRLIGHDPLYQQAAHTERTSAHIDTYGWQGTSGEIADIPVAGGSFRVACDFGALEDCLRGSVAERATDRYADSMNA